MINGVEVVFLSDGRLAEDYHYRYDRVANVISRNLGPAEPDGPMTRNAGQDRLEFGAGITIDDLMLQRLNGDLRIAIGQSTQFDAAQDQITLKEWFTTGAPIETFTFLLTGNHNMTAMNLAGGTDGNDVINGVAGKGTG